MTEEELDDLVRRAYKLGAITGFKDGFEMGMQDGHAQGKRAANGKPFLVKRPGRPRKGETLHTPKPEAAIEAYLKHHSRAYYVYCLYDTNGDPFYVGSSCDPRRAYHHMHQAQGALKKGFQRGKNEVILKMRDAGLKPKLRTLVEGLSRSEATRVGTKRSQK